MSNSISSNQKGIEKMKIVGLTGGIGSGKSTFAKWFLEKNIPVYDSDKEAKDLINQNEEIKSKLKQSFGEKTYENGEYNRKHVAELVFKNPEKLKKLNKIVHPAVFEHFQNWLKNQTVDFVVKEAAILFESGSFKDCDSIISIISSVPIRVERIKKRDNSSEKQIKERMENQWTDEQRIQHSDFVVENNSDLEHLKSEFEKVWKELQKRYSSYEDSENKKS